MTLSHQDVIIPVADGEVYATFTPPSEAGPLVIFAHGSGSSRHSPRNQYVAEHLHDAGFGTLLLDLLNEDEDLYIENRFDIPLLASRLVSAVQWAKPGHVGLKNPVAFFGASTGAAAALVAAAQLGDQICCVVSRGGRPDLAGESLRSVVSPTLMIVGSRDTDVLELNYQAKAKLPLGTPRDVAIVPGASHLFEEGGTLEQAARLATCWIQKYSARHRQRHMA